MAHWLLLGGSVALVVWIRLLPLDLGALHKIARQEVTIGLAKQFWGDLPPTIPQASRTAEVRRRVDHWIDEHRSAFELQSRQGAARLAAQFHYRGEDGDEHVFLGDLDSYQWLRMARNYLRTGETCDTIINGECRDTLTNAPVGRRNIYHRSLHIAAIAALELLISRFRANYPLPSASFLVPVIVGALGVFPAFGLGWRLAGDLGGLGAAIVVGLNPLFLARSMGSDDDIWNLVLPLCMVWLAVEALYAVRRRDQVLLAAGAAFVVGLHAATWRGWTFTYGVLLFGLCANLTVSALRCLIHRSARISGSAGFRNVLRVAATFYVAAAVFTMSAGAGSYFKVPLSLIRPFASAGSPESGHLAQAAYWPDSFTTVAELVPRNLADISDYMGGPFLFLIGWLGLLVLVLPRRRWNAWDFAVLIAGNFLYRYLLTASQLNRFVLVALILLPLAASVLLNLAFGEPNTEAERGAELIVVAWFLGALLLAYQGSRFVMLLVPPFGIAFAVALGRLQQWLDLSLLSLGENYAPYLRLPAFAVVAAVLILPAKGGYAEARDYLPRVNRAWWMSLEKIRDDSPADSIVTSWWDYGYWVKYVAQRRVSGDGGSLATHIPYWLSRILIASSDRESVGLLRMLDCGSDATPEPEGREGAYGKLRSYGIDPIQSHSIVIALAGMRQPEAAAYLEQQGLSESAQADILRSTHCSPPPAYLVLTSALADQRWWYLANWDFRKAYLVNRDRYLPQSEAVSDLVKRFGYPHAEADTLYQKATQLKSKSDQRNFIAPEAGYLSTNWFACNASLGSELICPVGRSIGHGKVFERVTYREDAPSQSRVVISTPGSANDPSGDEEEAMPALIVRAGAEAIDNVWFRDPTFPNLAILLDLVERRALIGPPYLICSTFTRLVYLGGRYSKLFTRINSQTGYEGERVTTWKIDWERLESPATNSTGDPECLQKGD